MPSEGLREREEIKGFPIKTATTFMPKQSVGAVFPCGCGLKKNDKEPIYSNLQLQQVQLYCGSAFLSYDDGSAGDPGSENV